MAEKQSLLKQIPGVDLLLQEPEIRELGARLSHRTVVGLIREVLSEKRGAILRGEGTPEKVTPAAIVARIQECARELSAPPLRKVINATGILIHTNLGRAPLSPGAQQAVSDILAGYCNLELDLRTGRRSSRLARVRDLLVRVTGAADALAVNNNAGAVLLALQGLCFGREVLVSRGELVEIGGSFRLPDVMMASGAILREVGTTNRTRLADYARALGPETGMILKVHPSNFRITGYTEAAATAELAALAREHDIPMMEDLGSGALDVHPADYFGDEPRVQAVLAAGADLLSFSGDKLLGGPQAGILLGRADLVAQLRSHPLARVVRLDKLHLAALEATLIEYLSGTPGCRRVPLYRLLHRDVAELRTLGAELSRSLAERLPAGWSVELVETNAAVGGGSLPGQTLPSVGLAIARRGQSMDALARHLRQGRPAVVGRIEQDRLILDLRGLLAEDWALLGDLLPERIHALGAAAPAAEEQGQ
jgi:L-seryl-tRNA(Ser) seleniumtransferase